MQYRSGAGGGRGGRRRRARADAHPRAVERDVPAGGLRRRRGRGGARAADARVTAAVAAGVSREAMILDPGLGFAKRAEHSWTAAGRPRTASPRSAGRCSSGRRASRSCTRRSASGRPRSATGGRRRRSRRRARRRAHRARARVCRRWWTSCAWPTCSRRRRRDSIGDESGDDTIEPELGELLRHDPPTAWRDVLDIAIVSILIYEFLKLIRGTRAAQMASAPLSSCSCSTSRGWRSSRRSTG